MSDHEPEATPEQQEQVRRLLAAARHADPVPPAVAQRLDGVLAQLVAEGPRAIDPPPPPPHAAVVDLAARRRRRVTGLLVAAAAVVAIGVGVGQVVDSAGDGDADTAASTAERDDAGAAEEPADEFMDSDAQGGSQEPESAPSVVPPAQGPPSDAGIPRVRARTFAADAERLRATPGVMADGDGVVRSDRLSPDPMFVCATADWGPGRLVAVLLDGDVPSVLAYRPTSGDTVTVELLQCGTARVRLSTVLPASS